MDQTTELERATALIEQARSLPGTSMQTRALLSDAASAIKSVVREQAGAAREAICSRAGRRYTEGWRP